MSFEKSRFISTSILLLCCLSVNENSLGEEVRNLSGTWKLSYPDGTTSLLLIAQKSKTVTGRIRSLGVDIITFKGTVDGTRFEFKEKILTSKGKNFFCVSDGEIEANKLIGKTKCAGQLMGSWVALRMGNKKSSLEKQSTRSGPSQN